MSETPGIKERTPHRTLSAMPPTVFEVDDGLRSLADHGIAVHEDFISEDLADRLRERMDEQAYMERKLGVGYVSGEYGLSGEPTQGSGAVRMARKGEVAEPVYQIMYSLVNKGKVFRELMMNETAHAYANGVFGEFPWTLWGMNGIITRRGSAQQVLHTDSQTLPPDMLTRPVMINCFICVSDFEMDMGPTSFVPGSHLGPRPRYDGDHEAPRAFAVAKKGSAVIWDGSTWHGQSEHQSDKTRYSIAMSYCLYAIRSGECYPASIQDEVLDQLSEEELKVLGFETTLVGSMNGFSPRNAQDKHHGIGSSFNFVPELHRD